MTWVMLTWTQATMTHRLGEAVVNQRDIIMLEKLNEDADDEEEPPPPSDNEEDMCDSDDETGPQIDYNSDDSYGF